MKQSELRNVDLRTFKAPNAAIRKQGEELVKAAKADRVKRNESSKKDSYQCAKEMATYFRSKARSRTFVSFA